MSAPSDFALLCRVGFEPDLVDELAAWFEARQGGARMEKMQDGVVRVRAASALPPLADLAFARDLMVVCAELPALNAKDRVSPLAASLDAAALLGAPEVLAPDAEATKPLAPLLTALAARLATRPGVRPVFEHQTDHLAPVIWMLSGTHALVGHAPAHGGAVFAGGIPRLKFPREAPSRSTLKLEEAFHVLMTETERAKLLRAGSHAVDLGAAPGGWTYQLVARQISVVAIDNGPMDARLLQSGLVEHLREDGFRYKPQRPVDWLVCDMVEKPARVVELVVHWFASGWCRAAIFNLKLPMKRRFQAWAEARLALTAAVGASYAVRARQLYHDREEITVAIMPLRTPGKSLPVNVAQMPAARAPKAGRAAPAPRSTRTAAGVSAPTKTAVAKPTRTADAGRAGKAAPTRAGGKPERPAAVSRGAKPTKPGAIGKRAFAGTGATMVKPAKPAQRAAAGKPAPAGKAPSANPDRRGRAGAARGAGAPARKRR